MRNDLAALITTVFLLPAFSIGLVQAGNAENIASDQDALNKQDGQSTSNAEGEKRAGRPRAAAGNSTDAQTGKTAPDTQIGQSAATPAPAAGNAANDQGSQTAANSQSEQPAARLNPTKLHCRATRTDLGMYEPLRLMSITVDPAKKNVKVIHEGDGQTFEFTDGSTSVQGYRKFVKVTEETIVYGQGRELWKIHRYTGTLTSASIAIPFECQVRPSERKF